MSSSAALTDVDELMAARRSLRGYVRRTPLAPSALSVSLDGIDLRLKLENQQVTGSFKPRGAFHRLLRMSAEDLRRGVITGSAGNHGQGLALAARTLGAAATIVTPKNAAENKKEALRRSGAELIEHGADYDEAEAFALELAASRSMTFVHAFADRDVILGQATVGLEILEQWPQVQAVLVPVGGGGLISGVAAAIKTFRPSVLVIGVESEASAAMHAALAAGTNTETPIGETIADGLAGRFVSEITLQWTQRYVDRMLLVSEAALREAMRRLLLEDRQVAEASGAAGVAAALLHRTDLPRNTVAIVSGANADADLLRAVLAG